MLLKKYLEQNSWNRHEKGWSSISLAEKERYHLRPRPHKFWH